VERGPCCRPGWSKGLIGEAVWTLHDEEEAPLLYHDGKYWHPGELGADDAADRLTVPSALTFAVLRPMLIA
jgi:hypothetical protein